MFLLKNKFLVLFITVGLSIPVFFVSASITQGVIDSTYKYAWSDQAGWINFGCSNCNVQISDDSITGYAWSENYGWINLNPNQGGVTNSNGTGVLGGKAWGENTGWINFAGVSINDAGRFTGTAVSDIVGNITFNCSDNPDNCSWGVLTDWRPKINRGSGGGAVSAGGGGQLLPPVEGFHISINEGATITNKQSVNIYLDGGISSTGAEISESPDFKGSAPEAYEQAKLWILSPSDGKKNDLRKIHWARRESFSGFVGQHNFRYASARNKS